MGSVRKSKSRKFQVNTSFPWKKFIGSEHPVCGLSPRVLKKMLLILLLTAVAVRVGKTLRHMPGCNLHLWAAVRCTVPTHGTTNCCRLAKALPGMLLFLSFLGVSVLVVSLTMFPGTVCCLWPAEWGNPGKHCTSVSVVIYCVLAVPHCTVAI